MQNKIKDAFSKIKDELNDYRECLNQNTNEIQSNYEYICRLETKVDKLTERVDELSLFIQKLTDTCPEKKSDKFSVSTLTRKEQEVFMAIYISPKGATYSQIARKTGLTENLVICYITNLVAKGVPLIKQYLASDVMISIDEEFKQLQTQHNILQISESVSQSVC